MNTTLGHINCHGCGGTAEVKQARRRGAHLYTNCAACGTDQRNGRKVQNRLFYGSKWLGEIPTAPENIDTEEDYERDNKNDKNQGLRPKDEPEEIRVCAVKTEPNFEEIEGAILGLGSRSEKSKSKTIGALILATIIGGGSWLATKKR